MNNYVFNKAMNYTASIIIQNKKNELAPCVFIIHEIYYTCSIVGEKKYVFFYILYLYFLSFLPINICWTFEKKKRLVLLKAIENSCSFCSHFFSLKNVSTFLSSMIFVKLISCRKYFLPLNKRNV